MAVTVKILDPILSDDDADAMVELCERFGRYGLYTTETSQQTFAPKLFQRHDAAMNFLNTGGRFSAEESHRSLAARTNYFREEYAYGREVVVQGIEPFLRSPRLEAAAQEISGREIVEPAIAYANILVTGQELAIHTDVPEFRGANRRILPQWLLVVMRHSGLFEDRRLHIATGIGYFGRSIGGELVYYPDGRDGKPQTHATRHNTAVVLDTDSVFHGVDRVGGWDTSVAPLRPGAVLTFDDDRWVACGDNGDVLATYAWEEIRLSISWKAYCFTDESERNQWKSSANDALSLEAILDVLRRDLVRRGTPLPELPGDENELGQLLIDTYIQFPPASLRT